MKPVLLYSRKTWRITAMMNLNWTPFIGNNVEKWLLKNTRQNMKCQII